MSRITPIFRKDLCLKVTERGEHLALMQWIRTQPEINRYVIHIANERKCTPRQGKLLKDMGVRAGVPDFFFPCPKGGYHGMWVELKVGKNKLLPEQKEFLALMTSVGYVAVCAVGFDAAKAFIEEYFSL
jgi:hypothetical protein